MTRQTDINDMPGYKTYHFANFQEADTNLKNNGYRSVGQDGKLGHIYSKVIATQGYGLTDIYARAVGDMTGSYLVSRCEAPVKAKASNA